jgi:hypothetical protein
MQVELFSGEVVQVPKKKPRKSVVAHAKLIELYGAVDNKCKNCQFLRRRHYSKTYSKCERSGLMGATSNHDWSMYWQACGLFIQDPNMLP